MVSLAPAAARGAVTGGSCQPRGVLANRGPAHAPPGRFAFFQQVHRHRQGGGGQGRAAAQHRRWHLPAMDAPIWRRHCSLLQNAVSPAAGWRTPFASGARHSITLKTGPNSPGHCSTRHPNADTQASFHPGAGPLQKRRARPRRHSTRGASNSPAWSCCSARISSRRCWRDWRPVWPPNRSRCCSSCR